MENQNLQMSMSSYSSVNDPEFDDLDFSSGDEFDQTVNQINWSLQFSNKLRRDKGNVRTEDKPMFCNKSEETNCKCSIAIDSYSEMDWSDMLNKGMDFTDLWGDQVEFENTSWDQSDQGFVTNGTYNKFVFAWQNNSDEPLVTIVEESCESEASF